MTLLNFAHALTETQMGAIQGIVGSAIESVKNIRCQFEQDRPFSEQVSVMIDCIAFSPDDWQSLPLLVNPPSHAAIAAVVIAELHGRIGHFPTIVRMKPVSGSNPPSYTVGEIVNLQGIRDAARAKR